MLRLRAHAKVNLALRVGAAGADGFHPLATVFQTVSLCDVLYAWRVDRAHGARPGEGPAAALPLRLRVVGADLPADNTVSKAVALLAAEVLEHGIEPAPLHMRLLKRTPMGAGLGGGSSDAVAALAACVRLWSVDAGLLQATGALPRIAAQIGSDVPFFLLGGTALGTGRGTRVEALDSLPPVWLVVAAPHLHVPTPNAYAAFDRRAARTAAALADSGLPPAGAPPLPPYEPRLDPAWMGNDLAAAVCEMHPEVGGVRRRLRDLGADPAQMSGSGAASFGAFANRRAAARAAAALRAEGVWAGAFVSISGSQHRRGLFGEEPELTGGGV